MATAAQGLSFSLEPDQAQLKRLMRTLSHPQKQMPKALRFAVNEAMIRGERRIVAALGKHLNLKKSRLRRAPSGTKTKGKARITKTRAKSGGGRPTAVIGLKKDDIPLVEYMGAKSKAARLITRAGKPRKLVSVQPRKTGAMEVHQQTFAARMRSGHVGLFRVNRNANKGSVGGRKLKGHRREERVGPSGKYLSELPIREVSGPTIAGAFEGVANLSREQIREIEIDMDARMVQIIDLLIDGKTPIARRILGI